MALTDNLVAYWNFQGNSNDVTGNGWNGTDTSMVYNSANGKIGDGAACNGTTNEIALGNIGVAGATARSICAWFRTTANGGNIFSQGITNANNGFFVNMGSSGSNNGAIDIGNWDGNGVWSTTPTFNDGNFHFLVVTYNGGNFNTTNVLVYVDGSPITMMGGNNAAQNTTNSNYGLGWWSAIDGFRWNGSLDEIGLWNRVLTSGEVTQLYNGGAGLTYPFVSTPVNLPLMQHMQIAGGLM